MYQVEVNKQSVQNHMQYGWWKYLVAILLTIAIWNFTTMRIEDRKIPKDARMEIYLVGDFLFDNDVVDSVSEDILNNITSLKKLDIINIPVANLTEQIKKLEQNEKTAMGEKIDVPEDENAGQAGEEDSAVKQPEMDPQLSYMGEQKLAAIIGSRSGDIFLFERDRYEVYAKNGAFMPLDDNVDRLSPYIQSEDELEELKIKGEEDDKPKLYGVPADSISLFDGSGYDTDGKVVCIMAYTNIPDKSMDVLEWLLSNGKQTK